MLIAYIHNPGLIKISLLSVFLISSLYGDTDSQRAEQFRDSQQQWRQLQPESSIAPACIFRSLTIADQPERDTFKISWFRQGASCDLKLSACGGEIRAAQFAVVPTGSSKDIINLDFTVTEFKSSKGKIIPAKNISVHAVDFVPIDKHREVRSGYNGWKADVLLPKGIVKVYPETITPVWIKIKVPAGTPKGRYLGQIISNTMSGPAVNVELNIWAFDMPSERHFSTSFWISRGQLKEYYGRDLTWDEYTPWLDALLEARLSPVDFYEGPCENWFKAYKEPDGSITIDISKWQRYAEYIFQRGATSVNIAPTHHFGHFMRGYLAIDRSEGYVAGLDGLGFQEKRVMLNAEESQQVASRSLRKAWDFLERNGWSDRAYIQPIDEPHTEEGYENARKALTSIKQSIPRIKTLIALNSPKHDRFPVIAELLDIPVPLDYVYTPAELAELHKKNKLGWTYLAIQMSPCIVFKQPWDSRLMWWRYFDSGVDGYLYWSANYWYFFGSSWAAKRPAIKDRWPAKPCQFFCGDGDLQQGDGVYLVPGPDMKPYPRLCLELTREGMQDFEYFWLLRKLVSDGRNEKKYPELCRRGEDLLNRISEVVQNDSRGLIAEYQRRPGEGSVMSEWFWKAPQTSEAIEEYREEVGEVIEKLYSR
jgi:hypothetical protein